ncbi:MAG: hypothetical protein GYA55_04560, partial [SAR324 cluster bacterium]|nr:hypothetical protein [SAR324 cluster bacterium]
FLYQDNPTDWFSAFEPGSQTRTDIFNMQETGYNFGQHMSRMSNPGLRGWFFMATYTQPCTDDWASNQFLMIEIANYNRKNPDGSANPPRLWRIGSSQNGPYAVCGSDKDYFAEGFAMLDYEGKNIFVGSNWNRKDNLELYKLELPTTWYETLNGNIKYPQAPTGLTIKN